MIDNKLPNINQTKFRLICKLINYKQGWGITDNELNKLISDKVYSYQEGWLLARNITDGIICPGHRSMYLKPLLKQNVIERATLKLIKERKTRLVFNKNVSFFNTHIKTGKNPWIIYRLRKDKSIPFKIFRLFYERGQIWDLVTSDYFNDTIGEEFKFWLLKHLMEKKDLIDPITSNKSKIKKIYVEFYKLIYQGLTIPPSMVDYFIKGGSLKLSESITIIDMLLSFLMLDFQECNDEVWSKKLEESIKNLKNMKEKNKE